MNTGRMPALIAGYACWDLVIETDRWPEPGEKQTMRRQVRCPGGGAANAARAAAALGLPCELAVPIGVDPQGAELHLALAQAGIQVKPYNVQETFTNVARPHEGERDFMRAPPSEYLHPEMFDDLDVRKFCRLHLDGKEPFALPYARAFHEAGLPVSLDTNPRDNTDDLLGFVRYAFASEAFFRTKKCSLDEFFDFLRGKGVQAGGVTFGPKGVCWFAPEEAGETPAFTVDTVDSGGAGDSFNGAIVALSELTDWSWQKRIGYASAVGAMMVTQFGNHKFPALDNITAFMNGRPQEVRPAANQ